MVRERGLTYIAIGAEAARLLERRLRRLDVRALREGRLRFAPEGALPAPLRILRGEGPGVVVSSEEPPSRGRGPRPGDDPFGSVGRLAAFVAHEINNPLDGCLRFVQLALDPRTNGGERQEYLARAKDGLARMAAVVRELLAFARSAAPGARDVDLHELLAQAESAVRGTAQPRVRLRTHPDLARVPEGLFPVFTNLLKNALDATVPDGRVEVSARRTRGGALLVEVRDDGPGIPPGELEHVFEPFFTRKARGTGLGLSIARDVARRYGARLLLRSRPGQGTSALFLLPAHKRKPSLAR